MGQNKIPFLYIPRANDEDDFDDDYDNRLTKLTSCIQHKGDAYKVDNSAVFSIWVQYTKNSESTLIIQANETRQNIQNTWKQLRHHFEGDTYK